MQDQLLMSKISLSNCVLPVHIHLFLWPNYTLDAQEREHFFSYHVQKRYLISVTARILAFQKSMQDKDSKHMPFLGKPVALIHTFKIRTVSSGQSHYASCLGVLRILVRGEVNRCRPQPKKPCWNEELFFMLLIQSMFLLCILQNFWFGLLWALLDTLQSPIHVTGAHSTSKKSLGGLLQGVL